MTQVRGKITRPDGSPLLGASVRFELVGANRAFVSADDETVLRDQLATPLDGAGAYLIDLPGNTALNPANTRWRRILEGFGGQAVKDEIVVPGTGGPYWEEDILAAGAGNIPTTDPSNELDFAERTTSPGGLVLTGFNIVPVPLVTVTVPDVPRPVYLFCQLWMESNTANVNIASMIAPVGSNTIGQQIAAAQGFVGAIGKETSPMAWARLPAHSPGEYQAFVGGDAGTVTLIAGAHHQLAVLGV